MIVAGVELGGTKVLCGVGTGPDDLEEVERIPTGDPDETLAAVAAFLAGRDVAAVGVGTFGPVELRRDHPRYGTLLETPKPGWRGVDLLGPLQAVTEAPIALATDVEAAALGEGRWGAGRGARRLLYATVGTGIGAGMLSGGVFVRGPGHPEMGHIPVARLPGDDFEGVCPAHGDCLEGLASGPALAARFGRPAEELGGEHREEARRLVAGYLAMGMAAWTYTAVPDRIVVGGGVSALPGLLPRLRVALAARLGTYPGLSEHLRVGYVVPAMLGDRAGLVGALALGARLVGPQGFEP